MSSVEVIGWTPSGALRLLDQTLLPGEVRHVEVHPTDQIIEAIHSLRVRGAPLIGVAAAMGLAAIAQRRVTPGGSPGGTGGALTLEWFDREAARVASARPTAMNLRWAVDRMRRTAGDALAAGVNAGEGGARLGAGAQRRGDEGAAMCP